MLNTISLQDLNDIELVPQAILKKPLSFFHGTLGIKFVRACDDLDEYEGAALSLNTGLKFVLRHYAGYPEDTTTIYLPRSCERVDEITRIIGRILEELNLSRDSISWERTNDPTL